MPPKLVTAPEVRALTVAAVKQNLRIAHDDDHDLLLSLIDAVTSLLDGPFGVLRNCLLDQVWEVRGPDWRSARLNLGNVQSIEQATYWPPDATEAVTLDPDAYRLADDAQGAVLVLADGLRPELALRRDAISVRFKAGYGPSADTVPAAVRQAMQLLVGHFYKHSEAVITGTRPTELPMGVRALLAPYRLQRV